MTKEYVDQQFCDDCKKPMEFLWSENVDVEDGIRVIHAVYYCHICKKEVGRTEWGLPVDVI